MTPTLIRHDDTRPARARDWAEIQERMFVPLYDAVYDRLGVGRGTRLLGLACGSGLALLRAAARGAEVTGADTDGERLRLARERLLPEPEWGARRWPARLVTGAPPPAGEAPYTLITAFGAPPGQEELRRAAALAAPGAKVVLAGWGEPGQCAATAALRVADRLTRPAAAPGPSAHAMADLADLATAAGLRPLETAEVSCPFGYPGLPCALRGLLATGSFDGAVTAVGADQVLKELAEALHPYVGDDGTIWLPNQLAYLVAEVP